MNQHYNDQAVQVAQRFLQQHRDEHLSPDRVQLIDRCARHLTGVFEISHRASVEIAIKVWGELQARTSRWHIDQVRTTRNALVLQSDDGERIRVITVDELICPPRWIGVDMGSSSESYQQQFLQQPTSG